MKTIRRPGYGLYRGHEYRMRARGKHVVMWAVEVDGERMTGWHLNIHAAVAEFKAGVDDLSA